MDLLRLLETRSLRRADPDDPPALPPLADLPLASLEAAAQRRRERALDDLARASGARVCRLGTQRVLVIRRRHDPDRLAQALAGGAATLQPTLAAYAGHAAFRGLATSRLLFLDTETTGLSHGAGTFAFLVGLATLGPEGLISTRLFIPEPADEPLALRILLGFLKRWPHLVTYNGKGFDLHILRSRLALTYPLRALDEDPRLLPHLDLLHLARRLWRHRLERVTLQALEREVLGTERQGDVAGSLIPAIYFDFLHRGALEGMLGVLEHNLLDVLSMVALLGHLAGHLERGRFADPGEALGVARLMWDKGMQDEALAMLARLEHVPDAGPLRGAWLALVRRALKRRALPAVDRLALADALRDELLGDDEAQRLIARLERPR